MEQPDAEHALVHTWQQQIDGVFRRRDSAHRARSREIEREIAAQERQRPEPATNP